MNQEERWKQEAETAWSWNRGMRGLYDHIAHDCYIGGYIAARKKAQEEYERLERRYENIDKYAKDVCIIYERKIAAQEEELEKRDRLLAEAKNYVHELYYETESEQRESECQQWLKQYEEMRLK